MLTFEEIKKLTAYQLEVFKDVFATKEDLEGLRGQFRHMQNTLDSALKDGKDNKQEILVNGHRVDRLEKWAKKAGGKIDIKFET